MRKRILAMLCTIAVLCTMLTSIAFAQTNDQELKKVDGSYLTHEESSTGTSSTLTRGEYLMTGDCTISNAGLTRVYAYASTTANQTVNYMQTIVYVDRYDPTDDEWGEYYSWVAEAENETFMSTAKSVTVDRGYYYRVRAIHIAGDQYPYDETASFTNGIFVP